MLKEADNRQLIVREKPLRANKGLIKGNRIAIKRDMTDTEKACVLAEELGHAALTVGDILDQSKPENRKQERKARIWGYKRMLKISDIIAALNKGCYCLEDVADHIGVTPEYLAEALTVIKEKEGISFRYEDYYVMLEPTFQYIKFFDSSSQQ